MENNKDFIVFDVDETLYFEHGQEVEEMLSISLDPDISLEVYETDVQIHGIMVLNGAYRKNVMELTEEEENEHQREMHSYIEKIVDNEEGEADFYHRFPINIAISKERIKHTEDVNVKITAFDYELPDHHTLKVSATIHITGLQEQEEPIKTDDIQTEETLEKETSKEIPTDPVSDHSTDEKEQEKLEVIDPEDNHDRSELLATDEAEDEKEIDISLKKTEESEETDEWTEVQFLTDLFGEKEEEMQATVTLYITQEEDTVEAIAKRFEMPTLQLIKENDLSGEKIESGQLLYITRK